MLDLVEAIIKADDEEIGQVFADEVALAEMGRVERRMKFMLHPDRNHHCQATMAFQKLSNSKWKLKYTKLLRSRPCWLLLTDKPCAAA